MKLAEILEEWKRKELEEFAQKLGFEKRDIRKMLKDELIDAIIDELKNEETLEEIIEELDKRHILILDVTLFPSEWQIEGVKSGEI